MLFCVFQYSNWQGITVLVGSVVCMVKLVGAFQFEIKALAKLSRLSKARAGKVLYILNFPPPAGLAGWLKKYGYCLPQCNEAFDCIAKAELFKKESSWKIGVLFCYSKFNLYNIFFFLHSYFNYRICVFRLICWIFENSVMLGTAKI